MAKWYRRVRSTDQQIRLESLIQVSTRVLMSGIMLKMKHLHYAISTMGHSERNTLLNTRDSKSTRQVKYLMKTVVIIISKIFVTISKLKVKQQMSLLSSVKSQVTSVLLTSAPFLILYLYKLSSMLFQAIISSLLNGEPNQSLNCSNTKVHLLMQPNIDHLSSTHKISEI